MKVLEFTKKKSKLVDKLVKLGFHYQSTDKEERPPKPARLINTWANVMNGVTLKIIDTYDTHRVSYYDYFGLPNILEALGKWDKQYGMDNEIGRC